MANALPTSRPHLSIGEVLSLLQKEFPDITISKIRFLESQGLLDPERTPSGYRKFYEPDIERLRWILGQQRDHFLPLKVIKDRLAEETGAAAAAGGSAPAAPEEPAAAGAAQGAKGRSGSKASAPVPPPEPDRAAFAQALDRLSAGRGAPAGTGTGASGGGNGPVSGSGSLDAGATDVSLTRPELAAASGLGERDIELLESYGLVRGRALGRETVFDGDALIVARLAASFQAHGLEPRHLRMFKVAAEREAAVYEQLVTSLLRQRNAEARHRAGTRLEELSGLGHELRSALLRSVFRGLVG